VNPKRWSIVLVAGVLAWACSEPPTDNAPSAMKSGIPGWLAPSKCFAADAAPVIFGADWPLTTPSGSPNINAPTLEQLDLVRSEINSSCGVRVTSGKKGSPLAFVVRDVTHDATQSAALTQELIAAGAIAIVGGAGSVQAPPAAELAVASGIPFGANQAAADALSGCTAAELADPAVVKSDAPVYEPGQCWNSRGLFFRTTEPGYGSGQLSATHARETYPALTTAGIIYRDDDFGRPNRDGVRDQFVELGGTVLAEVGRSSIGTSVDDFKAALVELTAADPSLILGNVCDQVFANFVEAYVELRDDPSWAGRPANFSTLRFVFSANLAGPYSNLSPAALDALVHQMEYTTPSPDLNSPAYQRWLALYQAYDPNAAPPASAFYMAAYDAATIMALAVTAAGSTDGAAIAAKIREVANPPGEVICPGQWQKAFRLLAKGKDINYEGAKGPEDLDERGNATGTAYGIFMYAPDGSAMQVGTFGGAPPPVCTDDDASED
jgi:ABC-type branched-subunit amino acid transport system substrate-binding protein